MLVKVTRINDKLLWLPFMESILNLLQDLVCITMSDIFLYSIHANVCPLSAISPIKNLYNIHL